jgi:hypothetical protein
MNPATTATTATNNIIPIRTPMQAPGSFFGTNDVSGFASVFVLYEGNRKAQIGTLRQLMASEPDSHSGLGAARWLASQGITVRD